MQYKCICQLSGTKFQTKLITLYGACGVELNTGSLCFRLHWNVKTTHDINNVFFVLALYSFPGQDNLENIKSANTHFFYSRPYSTPVIIKS